ncbi:MAG: SigB/SigF/SigG family RNA polymerase sigma factor [Clostridia bacterium]|nr:SigB/SigF/SigG family RNA polymerase sigma factor [Clostridia bacterium]
MLEYEETLKLLNKAKDGDEKAKELLIENNSPLVKSIVRRYKNKGVEYDDLYQLGCVGFVKAINNFDTSFNVKFSTYAVPMIAGEIKRFLRDDGSVKVSRSIKSQYYNMQKYIDQIRLKTGEPPTTKQLAEQFNIEEPEVMFILESSRMPVSIYETLDKESSNGQVILDKLVNYDEVSSLFDKMVLTEVLKELEDKDRKLIMLRYFRDKTQSEVAQILNVSQVQVSRLENKILAKMKNKLKD